MFSVKSSASLASMNIQPMSGRMYYSGGGSNNNKSPFSTKHLTSSRRKPSASAKRLAQCRHSSTLQPLIAIETRQQQQLPNGAKRPLGNSLEIRQTVLRRKNDHRIRYKSVPFCFWLNYALRRVAADLWAMVFRRSSVDGKNKCLSFKQKIA